jgi:hypothetical protein
MFQSLTVSSASLTPSYLLYLSRKSRDIAFLYVSRKWRDIMFLVCSLRTRYSIFCNCLVEGEMFSSSLVSSASLRTPQRRMFHTYIGQSHKRTYVFIQIMRLSCSILTKTGIPTKFIKNPKYKFHGNPSGRNRGFLCE